jgi:pyruvate formate lyase activating enzyme
LDLFYKIFLLLAIRYDTFISKYRDLERLGDIKIFFKRFFMSEAKFYQNLAGNQIQCNLCSHRCVIESNKTGLCEVRKNKQGLLKAQTFGYPAAINIDPVEKKPFFHFQPGSLTYSIGSLGCNFVCGNCQNHSLSQTKNIGAKTKNMDYITPERIIEEALGNGCQSIAFTYNEPTVFAEYALAIMELAKEVDLKNIWVSNGYMTEEALGEIIPLLDGINIDLKSMDADFYQKNCGARLEPVLENLRILKQEQVHVEITTLVIPGLTDDIQKLEELAEFISSELDNDTPWHISKFSPQISWKMKDRQPTGDDIIYEAYEIGKEAGLKYVYVGNIPGDQKENTYCPKCGELAIRRMGYHIERMDNRGHCIYCDRNLDMIE